MQPGQISVHDVGRRFRVNKHRNLTLKEAILRPEMRRTEEFWALRDVSFDAEPGESIGFVGRNGSGKTTLLRLIAGIFAPTTGRARGRAARSARCSSSAPASIPDFTGRENVFLNGSIYGLKRRYVRERLDEIVSFAELEQLHRPAGAHVLVGDAHAARVRGRGARGRGRPAARRGVRGRRRGVPAQVHRQDPRVQGARRDRLLRLALGARGRSGSASARSCSRRARSSSTGRRREAITRYHAVARARRRSRRSAAPACASGGAARSASERCSCSGRRRGARGAVPVRRAA